MNRSHSPDSLIQFTVLLATVCASAAEPIALHPENPHYFLWRGKPTVLITSAEHYGAVLNLDFDYLKYLDTLQAAGLNYTRIFSGTYREIPGSFNIRDNTLAPLPNRYIAPWARSDTPGYFDAGNKFDLKKWDEQYFARLKDFMTQAAQRGIVVEFTLFCPNYDLKLWKANPMHAGNNVNGIGGIPEKEPYTLKHKDLQEIQDAFVRKAVAELKDFDNLFYEICNEPYFGGVTLEWQAHIASVIVDAEKDFRHKHLIAQNIANKTAKIDKPNPAVSIFNFHYAAPPDAVATNFHLNKPITFDESGFRGSTDWPYRTEAWDFIIAGGAMYNNLDYSFSAKSPGGEAEISAPGGGGKELRAQLKALKDFIESFDFVKMAPDKTTYKDGAPNGATVRILSEPGKQYALFIHVPPPPKGKVPPSNKEKLAPASFDLSLELPEGTYAVLWLNTIGGKPEKRDEFKHAGGAKVLSAPPFPGETALSIRKKN